MKRRVLVVDDEPAVTELIATRLRASDMEVLTTLSGPKAIEWVEHEDLDLVLTDLRMPGASGTDVLRASKSAARAVPVVVVTANADLDAAVDCLRSGAFDLIQKPFHMASLMNTVQRALEHHDLTTERELVQASRAILTDHNQRGLPDVLLSLCRSMLGADDVSLMIPDADGQLTLVAASSKAAQASNVRVPPGQGVSGRIALLREPAVIQALADDPRFADLPSRQDVRSSIVYPLVMANGTLAGVLCLNRSSTDGKPFRARDLERVAVVASHLILVLENRRLLEQAAGSERLVALGQLAASVAHEINNPVAYTLSSQAFMERRLEPPASVRAALPEDVAAAFDDWLAQLRESLRDLGEGVRLVRDIAHDLKTLSRRDETARARLDVNDVVRASLRLAGADVRRQATLVVELSAGCMINGNAGRLSQVIVNLLINAAQALRDAPSDKKRHVTVRSVRREDRVIVTVADDGPGIPPDRLPKLFDSFFTTKRDGTGLGLAISRDIVRSHGGDLTARSNNGATFEISLPAVD